MKSLKDFINEKLSSQDLKKLKNAVEDVVWDMWSDGFDSEREKRESFQYTIDGENDMMIDTIINTLVSDYDFNEDDLNNSDEFIEYVKSCCEKCMDK